MANTGLGEKEAARTDKRDTAANSANYRRKDKANTGKTRRVTQAQALEILQESLRLCNDAGMIIGIQNDGANLIIGIQAVNLLDGWLIIANNGKVTE